MNASLISPSGKILVRRARCSTQPGPDPLAMPVLVKLSPEPELAPARSNQHAVCVHGQDADDDMVR